MSDNQNQYIFISYAHADSSIVIPIMEALKSRGIKIWYDEGIEAGSEWPEYIASKVMGCHSFLLFISPAYLRSQNCKRELNYAISCRKDILSIHLDDVQLSPGMEMQLGTYQAIFVNRFPSLDAFKDSLCKEPFFRACTGEAAVAGEASAESPEPKKTNEASFSQNSPNKQNGNGQQPPQGAQNFNNQYNPNFNNPYNPNFNNQYNPNFNNQAYGPNFNNPYNPNFNNQAYGPNFNGQPYYQPGVPYATLPKKSKLVAFLLALFLGPIGVHKFYLRRTGAGILYIVMTLILSAAGLAPLIWFWSFLDGLITLCTSDQKFEMKYRCRVR